MKRILSVLILAALMLSLLACSADDELIKYSESGLDFALPEEMKRLSVSPDYADICYGDGKAEFFVFFYSRDSLLSICHLPKDCTVREYAEWCIRFDDCTELEEKYDGPKRTVDYTFVADDKYYFAIVMRNNECLIHVTMWCPVEMAEEYKPTFELWRKHVALTYPDR